MKKIMFLFFITVICQVSLFGADLKPITEAQRLESFIISITTKLFSRPNVVETPFTEAEKNEWRGLVSKFANFITSKAKGDSDILKNYSEVVFGANKLTEIQPNLIKFAKTAAADRDISTLQGVVKSMANVVNTYETLSKKITAKLWSSDKKDAWRLINIFAKYNQVNAEKLINDYKKFRAGTTKSAP